MRGFVIAAVAVAALAAGTLVIGRTAPVDAEQAANKAYRAFLADLAKGDQKAVGAALDRRFTWTDRQGRTLKRREMLEQFAAFAAADQRDGDVQTRFYGRVLSVRGSHDNARFVRIFVKRRHGWRAFALLQTPMAASRGPAAEQTAVAAAGDCDNPCRSVPYAPRTPVEKDVLAAWQRTKMLEWQPDAAQWARLVGDEFVLINSTTVRDKEASIAILKRQEEAGTGTPGDPVTAMRIYGLGTSAALMISRHVPYRGGQPYTALSVWVFRDNRWQLALSQQVEIQSAAPAVASQQ
ncbi:MAG: nuclear transport factor 2 family protein [Xanthobacteraceae bacterium]